MVIANLSAFLITVAWAVGFPSAGVLVLIALVWAAR